MSQPQQFEHEVSVGLASLIPEDVRDDPERLKDWVNRALEIGLKAMIEGSGSVDLSFVSNEFEGWKVAVSDKLIGPKSDFEGGGLANWLPRSEIWSGPAGSQPRFPGIKFSSKNTRLGEYQVPPRRSVLTTCTGLLLISGPS